MSAINKHAAAKACQAMRHAFNRKRLNRRRRRYWMHEFEHWAERATVGKPIATIRFYGRDF